MSKISRAAEAQNRKRVSQDQQVLLQQGKKIAAALAIHQSQTIAATEVLNAKAEGEPEGSQAREHYETQRLILQNQMALLYVADFLIASTCYRMTGGMSRVIQPFQEPTTEH